MKRPYRFDWTQPYFPLHLAAVCFVQQGRDGWPEGEFDHTTIDPMFQLIQAGDLQARGIRRGTGEVQPIIGIWQTATCGDESLPIPNWVGLWPADRHTLGSTIMIHGDPQGSPTWTHVELASDGLRTLFGISAPSSSPTDPYGVGDFIPTGKSGRPDVKPAILKISLERRARGEGLPNRKAEAAAIHSLMDELAKHHGWPVTAFSHVYETLRTYTGSN